MNYCPCCSDILLSHIRSSGAYWFCRTCWQEMPLSVLKNSIDLTKTQNQTSTFTTKQHSVTGWIGVQSLSA
ncbi:MAG TPA: hypothetical protein VK184_02740 [Nostocaceae cyanobacterium]|nr:hypothetical protein [Nostocaceae cyanobacterium]